MKKALMLAGIWWDDPLQRHQQFAQYLAKIGYDVYFIEHIVSSKFTFKKLVRAIRLKNSKQKAENDKFPNISIVSKHFLSPGSFLLDNYNCAVINNIIDEIGDEFDLVINYLPISTTDYFLRKVKTKKLIYDCVRNFSTWEGCPNDVNERENRLIYHADEIFTDSFYLTDMMRKRGNKEPIQFLPIATKEWKSGCQIKKIDKISNVGYFGSIGEHLNLKVFEEIAKEGFVIHLWGNSNQVLNFQYIDHGYQKDQERLSMEITSDCDAIVLPYKSNLDGVIPAKITQALVSKLPVFIGNFYDSRYLAEYLYIFDNPEDCINLIKTFNAQQFEGRTLKIQNFTRELDDDSQFKKFSRTITSLH